MFELDTRRALRVVSVLALALLTVALTLGADTPPRAGASGPPQPSGRAATVYRVPSVAPLRRYRTRLLRAERAARTGSAKHRADGRHRLSTLRRRLPLGRRVRACGGPSRHQAGRYVRAVLRALAVRPGRRRGRLLHEARSRVPRVQHCAGHAGPALSPAAGRVRHVFTIVLENESFAETFGAGQAMAPYLTRDLTGQGALLASYYGTGHNSLDNYIAMISGQSPNPDTQDDCRDPSTMGDAAHPSFRFDADGQAIGIGCTYPKSVPSIATQLTARGQTWKGYMEDMDAQPGKKRTTCQGPGSTPNRGAPGGTAKSPDDYAIKHNPFVYFHAVTDDQAGCDRRVVALPELKRDLARESTTPDYSYIVPNLCNDGHDRPSCSDGSTGGLGKIDAWLKQAVPMIESSPAFKRDGLLLIVFDEADGDSSACCDEPKGPNLSATQNNGGQFSPPVPNAPPNGGGLTGAVAISRFVAPGTRSTVPYNHYSYLRTMEDIFGLSHLGYAARPGLKPFGSDVLTAGPGG